MLKSSPEVLAYAKLYRESHKEKIRAQMKKYRQDAVRNKEHKKYMKAYNNRDRLTSDEKMLYLRNWKEKNRNRDQFNQTKSRCNQRGILFNIKYEDIIWPEFCPILHIPLDRSDRDHAPSMDRLYPEFGYTEGNVFVISNRANRMKQDCTIQDLEAIIKYIKDRS
jgi:hypothetical protein